MKKIIVCLLSLAAMAQHAHAQDEHDALRYSFTPYQGTARGIGIGGAVGSIGADFSSLSVNPAGIGIYKTSELLLSPSFVVSTNKATYMGTEASANSSKFNFSNFGIVIAGNQEKRGRRKTGWKAVNVGIGMNRLATFKNEYTYTGKNNKSSIIESYADDFNSLGGLNSSSLNSVNFAAYGAYQTYLIDRGSGADSNNAASYVPYAQGLNQSKRVTETGGMNEYLISVGGNYRDRFMLGATLGITSLKYDRVLRFNEEDASNNLNNDFKYMNFAERLATTGTGINLKIGAIVKPNQNFRFGFALHTPTHIELNDASSISITSHTDSLKTTIGVSNDPVTEYVQDSALVFNYSLNTPYKALASAMVLFGKMGFITADVEYVDYGAMRYNFGTGFENASNAINKVIKDAYKGAVNIRVGAEARLSNVSLRGGFAYYGSPYTSSASKGARSNISAGVGFRDRYWFIDATYMYSMQETSELPYILARKDAGIQAASIQNNRSNVVLTLGVKF